MTGASSVLTPAFDTPSARSTRAHFWQRIADQLSLDIGQGRYPPGERLPSEHQLAQHYGVNRHTIRRSLAALSQRGLVRATQGSGTFVESFAIDLVLGKRTRHAQSLQLAGVRGSLQVLQAQVNVAEPDIAQALGLKPGASVLWLRTLGEGDGRSLHVSDRYFPWPRFAELDRWVGDSGSITRALTQCGVADYLRKESRISARLPSAEVAAVLAQPMSVPVLQVTSVNVDAQGGPIEFARTWFAGDRVTLTIEHHE